MEKSNRKIKTVEITKVLTYIYILFFVGAGANHFLSPQFYDSIIPSFIPFPRLTHQFVGLLEITIPFLYLTKYKHLAGILMSLLLTLIYISNLYVWINKLPYGNLNYSNSQHILRLFGQILLVYLSIKLADII